MRLLILACAVILVTSTAVGAPTMGLYFGYVPGQMAYSPEQWVPFEVYLYLHNAPYYITAVEYQIRTPTDPTHTNIMLMEYTWAPQTVLELGSPWVGHSIAFWPPLSGYDTGYNLICGYRFLARYPCDMASGIAVYPMVVGPHPDSGALRGAYYPDNLLFPITGLTSIVCPFYVGTEETSWGAIKGLYR